MKPNLETLKDEVQSYLAEQHFVVYHGYSRLSDSTTTVHWDCEHYPDFRLFLRAAAKVEASVIVFHHREFTRASLDDALERLQDTELPFDEKREYERRLQELRTYDGRTCAVELSFDYQNRLYVYELRTDWYEELLDIVDEIEASLSEPRDGEDTPLGGYFSRN